MAYAEYVKFYWRDFVILKSSRHLVLDFEISIILVQILDSFRLI